MQLIINYNEVWTRIYENDRVHMTFRTAGGKAESAGGWRAVVMKWKWAFKLKEHQKWSSNPQWKPASRAHNPPGPIQSDKVRKMQVLSQCHAWTGTVCRKHIYCSFVPYYLQGFKPLLQGRKVSFPIKLGRIWLEAEAEEIVFNETSWGFTFQWCIKT